MASTKEFVLQNLASTLAAMTAAGGYSLDSPDVKRVAEPADRAGRYPVIYMLEPDEEKEYVSSKLATGALPLRLECWLENDGDDPSGAVTRALRDIEFAVTRDLRRGGNALDTLILRNQAVVTEDLRLIGVAPELRIQFRHEITALDGSALPSVSLPAAPVNPSVRERILGDAKTAIESIAGVGEVTRTAVAFDTLASLPAVVMPEPDEIKERHQAAYFCDMQLVLHCLVAADGTDPNAALNTFLESVEEKLVEDRTRGGWALRTRLSATVPTVTKYGDRLHSRAEATIHYRHGAGDPTTNRPGW